MKFFLARWYLMATLCLGTSFAARAQLATVEMDSFTVYFFLLEECVITQSYTLVLQELYREFAGNYIGFWGGFPNPVSSEASVAGFVNKYSLPFHCTTTEAYRRAKDFGVTVTPEVVVFNELKAKVVYQGRIDNLFERVGKRRKVVTAHELRDALTAIRRNTPVPVSRTVAVGCLLN